LRVVSKTQGLLIVIAGCLLFYAIGILTNLFSLPVFSMFFIISNQAAYDIAFVAAAIAVTLIGGTLIMSSTHKRSEGAQDNSADELRAVLRGNERLGVINASIGIVDLSFNVLIGLSEKPINWRRLEGYSKGFRKNLNFTGQLIPSLNLDFSKLFSAIKRQITEETSREAWNIMKGIYGYFDRLSLDDDVKGDVPNFLTTKAIILSYYLLNDILLGKAVGDKENKQQKAQLETVLQDLFDHSTFKVNVEELKANIDEVFAEADLERVIEDSRGIFKEQLWLFQSHVSPL
jgi:hypothetical protein